MSLSVGSKSIDLSDDVVNSKKNFNV